MGRLLQSHPAVGVDALMEPIRQVHDLNGHYLNLAEQDRDKRVYRVLSVERLLEMLGTRHNALVRPSKWDDPFENFLLRTVWSGQSGQPFTVGLRDQLYGQCWSLLPESDAMWRIYSADKQGVRITSTLSKLLASLWQAVTQVPELSCWIGKVTYHPRSQLKRMLEDGQGLASLTVDPTGRAQASSLLIKRREFEHEKEVRLIFFSPQPRKEDVFRYAVNPVEIIEHIRFDPRLSTDVTAVFARHLRDEAGFKGKIDQSSLYRLPEQWLKMGKFPY